MKSVWVVYEGGLNEYKDNLIRTAMSPFDEEGSGCGFDERDISYSVPDSEVERVADLMEYFGFRVQVVDYEDEISLK